MNRIGSLTLAALLGVAVWYAGPGLRGTPQLAFAQAVSPNCGAALGIATDGCLDSYKLSYFDVSTAFVPSAGGYGGPGSSGGTGDALLRIVNAGNTVVGDVCANIYVYNDVQEQQECCSCPLTANSLLTFSVINNLTSNPFNPFESLSAGVIKIVGSNGECNNSPTRTTAAGHFFDVAAGLHEWLNHTETMASNQASFKPSFGFITSTSVDEFANAVLDSGELFNLEGGCAAINDANLHASEAIGICQCGLGD